MLSLIQTGTIPFAADVDTVALPNHLAESLWGVDASTVEVQGSCVAFTRRMFRLVSNWNVLVPFESGDLTVDIATRQVRYRVSIRELVFLGTGMVGVLTIFLLMSRNPWALLFVPCAWLWLVGVNLLIGITRFKNFVARAVATAPHEARQSNWTASFRK
ncbi:MAG: hypothetical protein WCA13_16130 [Terriglobales bacterium]